MKITFLGTGTSVGVPRIACDCAVCRSDDPRNKRLRCSLLIEDRGNNILVDTTPDLRTQALRHDICRVDAVLFTHGHADHLHGLDDVRIYCFDRDTPLPCYADPKTLTRIAHVFDYAFKTDNPSAVPQLSLHPIDGPFSLSDLQIEPVTVYHGRLPVLGFRLGDFAYVTDCNRIPDDSMARLRNLDTLVLDALRYREHPTHFSVAQALDVVDELRPRRALFTHLTHDLDHPIACAELPAHVDLAYDGQILEFD
ncbi:MAG: MBL fold metallo-hydrolase [Gemmatimonadetes bacterium]|jgi:phosphoribosyl 1,2-cyclic phosphate phosphodiesterase|nr:MBL fold metallo-hydrolase [Gemmatimonadota bacterium]